MYRISFKDILCNTGIEPMFYNNYKWGITFKNPNQYIVYCNFIYQLYLYKNKNNTKNKNYAKVLQNS